MKRKPSDDPSVHRVIAAVSPPMLGRDVANLNRGSHDRLAARPALSKVVAAPTHDKFTTSALFAFVEAAYALGLHESTYLAKDAHGHHVATEGAQAIVRDPTKRNAAQLQAAKDRAARVARGPRYYAELARELGAGTDAGPRAALAWAIKQVGTTESPPGSNNGPKIAQWEALAGYEGPVFWCGCFANAVLVAGGLPSGAAWGIGYVPSIIGHARAGTDGWSWHGEGQIGDLVCYDEPGGVVGEHVGVVLKRVGEGHYLTVEGNTSPPAGSGSQANGGGVWQRDRVSTDSFRMVGFARPPWKS
jgi:hypothetical protein